MDFPSYTLQRRIRYGECDPMGVVYHSHYLNFFEEARTEGLREWGVVYKDLEAKGIILPVIDLSMSFSNPAKYDDVLYVESWVKSVPLVKLKTEYRAWVIREDQKVPVVKGRVTLAFVSKENMKPRRAPEEITNLFAKYEDSK